MKITRKELETLAGARCGSGLRTLNEVFPEGDKPTEGYTLWRRCKSGNALQWFLWRIAGHFGQNCYHLFQRVCESKDRYAKQVDIEWAKLAKKRVKWSEVKPYFESALEQLRKEA